MKFLYITIILLFLSIYTVQAQHDHHHHERNEIGVSTGALYGIDDKAWGTGVHIHYFRTLGDHSRWAVGAFAEQAWLDHSHFSFGVGAKFEVINRLHLGVFPGLSFVKHDHFHGDDDHGDEHIETSKSTKFSLHTELVYDLFTFGKFHLGPVIDYSWSKDDTHTMFGFHVAYGF